MWLIGSMWKCSNTWSWGILIGRKLDREYSLLWEIDWKYGDDSERETPVPIPNTEVKPLSADGTRVVTPRESRSSPNKDRLLKAVFLCAFDWMVFLEWIFSFHDQLDVSRIPKRARIGIKKDPRLRFWNRGSYVEREGRIRLSLLMSGPSCVEVLTNAWCLRFRSLQIPRLGWVPLKLK